MDINPRIKYDSCPRCGKKRLHPSLVMNALSRRDNTTYICSPCGSHEAILDASRNNPSFAIQMMEFMIDDIDTPFEIMTEEEEAKAWVTNVKTKV
jgi:predicted RNA-binding Zn-ribbon protein involved in translation (DUF1610 family)